MQRVIRRRKSGADKRDWKPPPSITTTSSPEPFPTPYEWEIEYSKPQVKLNYLKKEATSSPVKRRKKGKGNLDVQFPKTNGETMKEEVMKTPIQSAKRKRRAGKRLLKEVYIESESMCDQDTVSQKTRTRKRKCTKTTRAKRTNKQKTKIHRGKQSWGWLKCNHCKQLLTPNTGRTRNGWLHYYTVYRNDVLTKRIRHVCPSEDGRNIERSLDYRFKDCVLDCETSCISLISSPPQSQLSRRGSTTSSKRCELSTVSLKRKPKKKTEKQTLAPGSLDTSSQHSLDQSIFASERQKQNTLPYIHDLPPEIKMMPESPVVQGSVITDQCTRKNWHRRKSERSTTHEIRTSPHTVPVSMPYKSYATSGHAIPFMTTKKRIKRIPPLEMEEAYTIGSDRTGSSLSGFENESWSSSSLSGNLDIIRKELIGVRTENEILLKLLARQAKETEQQRVHVQKQGEMIERLLSRAGLRSSCNRRPSPVKQEPGS